MQDELIEAALNARIIFVMGAKDTGKTTTVKELANELFRRGSTVGVIDADVGQSDIGPPTTIGLGTVESELTHLSEAVLRHFYFVGATTPKGHLLPVMLGVRKMLDRAMALGLQKILFDTTGLVHGQLGRVLKEHKIAAINPDVIVCLQANQECEHILQQYRAFEKPKILRLPPDNQCREKTMAARRHYRDTTLQKAFAHAQEITCSLSEIGVFETPLFSGQPVSPQQLQAWMDILQGKPDDKLALRPLPLAPRLFWGEYLGKELHVVTSHKLTYDQFARVKQTSPDITYAKDYTPADFENMLVGVLNRRDEFCALGALKSIDFPTRQVLVYTSAAPQDIAGLTFSQYIIPING